MYRNSIRMYFAMLLVAIVSLYLCTWAGAQNKYEDSYNYQRATEAIGNEDYSSALDYLKKEVNIHKDNAYAYFMIASIYNKYEEYGYVVANVNLALKYAPKKDKVFISRNYSLRGDEDVYEGEYVERIVEVPLYKDRRRDKGTV